MKEQSAVNDRVIASLRQFLQRGDCEESTITLEGTGINASYHYLVLSLVGRERLERMRFVNAISGGTVSLIYFLAYCEGMLMCSRDEAKSWEPKFRKWHGVSWLTFLRYLIGAPFGRAPLHGDGHVRTSEGTIQAEFLDRSVESFPDNFRFWLHDCDRNEIVEVSAGSELRDFHLRDLLRCATSIPSVFGIAEVAGKRYMDPIFSPAIGELRNRFKQESKNALISNMLRDEQRETQIFVRPHGYANGNWVMKRDLYRFLMGRKNEEITDAALNGLYDTAPLPTT